MIGLGHGRWSALYIHGFRERTISLIWQIVSIVNGGVELVVITVEREREQRKKWRLCLWGRDVGERMTVEIFVKKH